MCVSFLADKWVRRGFDDEKNNTGRLIYNVGNYGLRKATARKRL